MLGTLQAGVIAPHRTDLGNSGREFSSMSTKIGFPTPFWLRNDHAYCPRKLLVADVVLRGAVYRLYKDVYILARYKGTHRIRNRLLKRRRSGGTMEETGHQRGFLEVCHRPLLIIAKLLRIDVRPHWDRAFDFVKIQLCLFATDRF